MPRSGTWATGQEKFIASLWSFKPMTGACFANPLGVVLLFAGGAGIVLLLGSVYVWHYVQKRGQPFKRAGLQLHEKSARQLAPQAMSDAIGAATFPA